MREQVLNLKQDLVSEIKNKFDSSNSAVVVEYRGLTVQQVTALRRQLRDENVEFKVYKNTMTRRAAEEAGYSDLMPALIGPNAIAFSEDAVAPSRVLAKFAKKNKALVIKSGVVEGKVVDYETLKELSELPNKEGMIAMLLGALQSPLRDFAWAMKQISEQKESGTEVVKEAPAKDEEVVVEEPTEEKAVEEEAVASEEVVEEKATEEVAEKE
ncbi:MAG: 50S ribosomal protein L10 [Erysipelothrix sp.]|nr:50S ribosomal protein L10 [Erysipelothrix sp.]